MNYKITHTHDTPAYIQLYQLIKDDIIKGIYTYGLRLPAKRTIAVESGCSVVTVEHALELLSEEGYIELRQRSGSYVIYKEADFLSNVYGDEKLDLNEGLQEGEAQGSKSEVFSTPDAGNSRDLSQTSSKNPGDFPYSVLARTMRKVITDYGENILVKGPNQGSFELRTEICRYLARSRRIYVEPDQIVVGAGAEYLYSLVAQLLRGDLPFAIESPSYEKIHMVYESLGIKCLFLPLTKDGISSKDLAGTQANILHVTPFNSYPTGITVGISKKKEYLKWASEKKAYIVEDNYDSELTVSRKAEEPLFAMSKEGNVIYMNTFSKTIAPSMRIGYLILPKKLMEPFGEKLGFYSCTVPLFEQYVLAELLKSGNYERNVNRIRRKRRKEG